MLSTPPVGKWGRPIGASARHCRWCILACFLYVKKNVVKKIWIFGYKGIPLQSQFGKYMSSRFGKREDSLAQLVEHNTFNVGVLGSNPKRITKLAFKMAFMTLP